MPGFAKSKRWVWRLCGSLALLAVLAASWAPVELHRWLGTDGWLQASPSAWAQVKARVAQQIARSPLGRRIDGLPPGHFGALVIALPSGKKQALQTRKLHVKVSLQGKVARTQVEQIFYNPTGRQTEGTFTFHLPDGAAIVRLAMDVNGKMVEGELVERTRARAIYSSIVRRMKDPALLEWQGGNRFRTQIFPIPARGTKRVIIAYDHMLEGPVGATEYVYHLAKAGKGPKVGDFSFSMSLPRGPKSKVSVTPYDATVQAKSKRFAISYKKKAFRSRGDIVVKVKQPVGKGVLHAGVVAGKKYGLLALPLRFQRQGKAFRDRILIVDTSAGVGDKGLAKAREIASKLLSSLPSGGRFGLVVGDVEARTFRKSLSDASQRQAALNFLKKQTPRGATDLQAMLLAGLKLANDQTEIIYIGDGLPSLGEMDPGLMVAALKKAIGRRQLRISAIGLGASPDMGLLRRIARETAGRALRLAAGQQPEAVADKLQNALSQPLLSRIKFSIKGMTQALRARKGVLASGETLLLAGQMTAPAIRVQIRGLINGKQPFSFKGVYEPADAVSAKLAPAFWARWTIESLQQKGVKKRRIIKLSKTFGVMSRYTSFLVLENDKAYKKHQIARRKHNARKKDQYGSSGAARFARSATKKKKERAKAIRQWLRPSGNTRTALSDSDDSGPAREAQRAPSAAGGGAPGRGFAFRGGRARRRLGGAPSPSFAQPPPPSAPAPTTAAPRKLAVAKPKPVRRKPPRARRPAHRTIQPQPRQRGNRLTMLRKALKKFPMAWYRHQSLVSYLMAQGKHREALKALRNWRRYARDNASLILREARLLKRLEQHVESRRVLSELVEFTPHAYARRALYARHLARLGNVTAACQQYGQAVRLNPAVRSSFRTMMGLYRSRQKNREYRDIIRQCIVNAVSRLPVVRDVSMVLFWDDPRADIDLHVHEPGGQEVYYRKRESKQGGTLYYDITNGLGPEIYVLGTGKKGTYKVTAVLYRGSPKVINATLVVLEHAGSPKEIRRTYKVKLHRKDGRKQVAITTIKIK